MPSVYYHAEKYLDKIDKGAWLEIGTERGDGSTKWFCQKSKECGAKFYAVDIDDDQIAKLKSLLIDPETNTLFSHVTLEISKGEDFLKDFYIKYKQFISLVYLDNFDWNYWIGHEDQWVIDIANKYQNKFNTQMTNINSQIAHLLQAVALMPLLTPNALVVCDDTWFMSEQGIFSGKSFPFAHSSKVPTMFLTILYKKPFPMNSNT